MGLDSLTAHQSLMPVCGCSLVLLPAELLTILLCWAWEHLDVSSGTLANAQAITDISVMLHWTSWNYSVNLSWQECDLGISPHGRTALSSCGYIHAGAGALQSICACGYVSAAACTC